MADCCTQHTEASRALCMDMLRECTREIALYSDPQSQSDYEGLIVALYKKARALNGLHQHPQEEACLEKAAKLARKGLPERNLEVPRALEKLAGCYVLRGDRNGALEGYQAAIALRFEAGLPEAHPAITGCMKKMADIYRDQNELEQALDLYDRVLQLRRSVLAEGEEKRDAGIAEALYEIGSTHHLMADFPTAIPYLKEALEVRKAAAAARDAGEKEVPASEKGSDPEAEDEEEEEREAVMDMMYALASTYAKNGEFTLAQPIYTELMARRRAEEPPNYIKLSKALNNVGAMHMEAGHAELALPFYTEALEISRAALPEDHPEVSQAMGNLAEVYRRMEEYAEAQRLFERSLELKRRSAREQDPMGMAGILNNCAMLHRAMDRYDDAVRHLQEAVAWVRRAMPPGHPYVTRMEGSLQNLMREREEKANGTYDPTKYGEGMLHGAGGPVIRSTEA